MLQTLHIHLSDALLVLGDLRSLGGNPLLFSTEVRVIECALQHLLTRFLQILIKLFPPAINGLQGRVSLLYNDPFQFFHGLPRLFHLIVVEVDGPDDRLHVLIDVFLPRRALRTLFGEATIVDMAFLLVRGKGAAAGAAQHASIRKQLSRGTGTILAFEDGLYTLEKFQRNKSWVFSGVLLSPHARSPDIEGIADDTVHAGCTQFFAPLVAALRSETALLHLDSQALDGVFPRCIEIVGHAHEGRRNRIKYLDAVSFVDVTNRRFARKTTLFQ